MMDAQTQEKLKFIRPEALIGCDEDANVISADFLLQLVRKQDEQNKLYRKLYEALYDKNVCIAKFDECGKNDDAEGQANIFPYINYYDDQIEKAMSDLKMVL